MNDRSVVELIDILNEEIKLFNQLQNLLQQEQTAIVEDDLQGIEASVAAQQQIAGQAQALEQRRIQVVADLSRQLNAKSGNPSLVRLIEALEGEQGEELARMREQLLALNRKIRTTSENNAFLIRQSLRYTERCLDILTGQPLGRGMYGKFGRARRNGDRHSVLNRTV